MNATQMLAAMAIAGSQTKFDEELPPVGHVRFVSTKQAACLPEDVGVIVTPPAGGTWLVSLFADNQACCVRIG